MSNAGFEALEKALREAPTPEARKAAAEAMRRYVQTQKLDFKKRQGTTPKLVSLGKSAGYPNSIPLEKLPEEMERNPALYDNIRRIITREKS